MQKLLLVILAMVLPVLPLYAFCDEDTSQGKIWTLEARRREETREEREKYYKSLSPEARIQISDVLGTYPTDPMTCGMGFSNGRAKVMVGGKAGFIDGKGALVIKANLKNAGRFSENLAPFESKNGKWGYINLDGKIAIEPKFDWALSFREGFGLVNVGEKWGFIDSTGKIIIEPQFDAAGGFSEGLAHVQLYLLGELPGYKEPTKRYKTGYLDKAGNWAIKPTWEGGDNFDGGMARVDRNIGYNRGVVSESLFIDQTGKELWILDSWYLADFSDNVLVIAVEGANDGYSIIDRNGKWLTNKVFDDIDGFSEGLAAAELGEKTGFMDKKGNFVIRRKFDSAGRFSQGLAGACIDGSCGYIDHKGDFMIAPQFSWVEEFSEGFALVADGQKTGYIDKTGKYIWKPTE
jgi:hypothetical protein